MNKKPIGQAEFDAKRKLAKENEPVARVINLKQLELDPKSYREQFVVIDGQQVAVDFSFLTRLADFLSVSGKMRRDLLGTSGNQGDSAGVLAGMMGALKEIRQGRGRTKQNITIIGDPGRGKLVSLTEKPYNRLPNEAVFSIAEKIMEKDPRLAPISIDVTGGGMSMSMRFLADVEKRYGKDAFGSKLQQLKEDELFYFGMSLGNGAGGTNIGDFMWRQICENGAMGFSDKPLFTLPGLTPEDINKLFEWLGSQIEHDFVPPTFESNLLAATRTNASYYEVEKTRAKVVSLMNVDDAEEKKEIAKLLTTQYFPGYEITRNKLVNNRIDPRDLTDKMKKFTNSGMRMWDLINNVTFLGSHNSGFDFSRSQSQSKLQGLGGKMMAEEHDLQYADLMKF